ncbi:right-handed parallel beta-helix repeat-containing protein [Desulfococcaceae bacterium HSG8]|nr:right-handed parallel beta-helix repeat-containing protein [Desulfococcaceae bacterium HSG8]
MKKKNVARLILIWIVISFVSTSQAAVIYVDAGAGGTGSSWADAATDLQSALSKAVSGDEIWVKTGTYKPTSGTDRSISFQLKNGVEIYGGFAGEESLLTQRSWTTNITILSGDIGTPDADSDNSYHLVTGSGTNDTAVLDGFTITKGYADGNDPHFYGGGMYNNGGSPEVANCVFTENTAGSGIDGGGGGMCNNEGSSPKVTNCTFTGNHATAIGGGMYNNDASSPKVNNCIFTGNTTENFGGAGMSDYQNSNPRVTNCFFAGNIAGGRGGGMSNWFASSPTVVNCIFSGNTSNQDGGGMYNRSESSPTVSNCTFNKNTSSSNGGGMYNKGNAPKIYNSIFWGNTAAASNSIYNDDSASSTVSYCIVEGVGNTSENDPKFINADGGDGVAGTSDDNLRLSGLSPAIDAGDNSLIPAGINTDLDGNARLSDAPEKADTGSGTPPITDIGAYEYGASELTPGDVNCDGKLNLQDAVLTLQVLGGSGTAGVCITDQNDDGLVGSEELVYILAELLK